MTIDLRSSSPGPDHRDWARRILDQHDAGVAVLTQVLEAAREALIGFPRHREKHVEGQRVDG